MEDIILNILAELRAGRAVDDRALVRIVHAQARADGAPKSSYAKRRLLPFYQRVKREEPERWAAWGVEPQLEEQLLGVLRMKPRRSASGVATITVITKPWPCGSDCRYCPSDVRCPKSYLHDEPACARAEQNFFDPYLQVSTRLTALAQMGHATGKVELIVLGGTWTDYPEAYRLWFARELFRALNDGLADEGGAAPTEAAEGAGGDLAEERRRWYHACGLPVGERELAAFASAAQDAVNAGETTYNQAVRQLYGGSAPWAQATAAQAATWDELEREQRANERARHRAVGLVFETRPDAITPVSLLQMRRMGATKVQMGVQSLDQRVLDANERGIGVERIQEAFELLRAFGFKIHVHAMMNLLGATPEADKADYLRLVRSPAFLPDEVKLYPCALIAGTRLERDFGSGAWAPYTEDELIDVLAADVLATPAFTRVSRMIRDFSSGDIVAGNKKPNLRQLVEERLREEGAKVQEIRFREVGTEAVDVDGLRLDELAYATSNTREHFLQWVTPEGRIAGFLRLSLPDAAWALAHAGGLPADAGWLPADGGGAMIREVHVYGMATQLGEPGRAAQHLGLGRRLVERACEIARAAGRARISVISAVGTREYYRGLGFVDAGLYQQREL